jgi:hypothetical protein
MTDSAPTALADAPRQLDAPTRSDRRYDIAALALLALHGALAWLNRAFVPGLWHDEANYMLLARSLRGLGYHDIYALGAPLHSQYPPGFPAFLAAWSLPFGERPSVYIAAVILSSVAALALLYDVMRKRGEGIALVVLALCVFNPELVLYAGRPLSEATYLFCTALTLWAIDRDTRESESGRSRWPVPIAMAAVVFAGLTRMIGVAMVGAVLAHWLLQRRYRRAVILAVVSAVGVGGWITWTIAARDKIVARSYIADATFSEKGRSNFFLTLVDRVTTNVPFYVTESIAQTLSLPRAERVAARLAPASNTARNGARMLDIVVGVALLLMTLIGARVLWRRGAEVAVLYVGFFAFILALWPWWLHRFLVPLIPLLLWLLIVGGTHLADQRRWLRPVPVLLTLAILVLSLVRDADTSRDSLRCNRAMAKSSERCAGPAEHGFFAAMHYIREQSPDTAIFLTATDHQLGFLGNRRALFVGAVQARQPGDLIAELRASGVDYILLTPIRPPSTQLLPLLSRMCDQLEPVREFPAVTLILRVRDQHLPSGEDACAHLKRYELSDVRSNLW